MHCLAADANRRRALVRLAFGASSCALPLSGLSTALQLFAIVCGLLFQIVLDQACWVREGCVVVETGADAGLGGMGCR